MDVMASTNFAVSIFLECFSRYQGPNIANLHHKLAPQNLLYLEICNIHKQVLVFWYVKKNFEYV